MVLLFLMLLALPLASRAKDTFYIEPVNVVPGESKTITLNLDNSQVFFVAFRLISNCLKV